ncbi:FAD:protein FMN transferase [Sorangium sp. So ce176]|uniref:FAD:protein FMN transferase n=1 Tax=Sorangium sp. So ce176 TaxID=3133286 RepID=UPI003F6472E1
MHGPRCSSRFLVCSLRLCLGAMLAPAACDVPACARARALQESAPAASTDAASPGPSQAAQAQAAPARVVVEARAMGTSLVLAAYTSDVMDEAAIRGRLEKAVAEIRRLEGLMTTWRPDSELSRVNAAAGKGAVEVSPESLAVIEKSLWISERSGGVFDITFEAMHGLWKFDEDIDDNVPPREDVERARALIDYRQIAIDSARRTVMLARPGMRLSLGGIAKGYAVDAAAQVLRAEGLTSFFVQAGGDLYIAGKKPDGSRWRAGVRDPRGKDANDYFAMIEVEDHAFSTAGDYERGFIKDGRRYHHILDPRTGFPATESRSVTLWAKDALTADAIDDAVFILGAEKGLALVEEIEDCGAVIVDRNNKVWVSKRLEGKVEVLRQPTEGL